jgi:hypothetical protein
MGATKSKWRGNQLAFFDGSTYETTEPFSPVYLFEDFLGTLLNGDLWTEADTGAGSCSVPAASVITMTQNVAGATDENGIYQSDDKAFNLDKGPIFEFRIAVSTAPTEGTEFLIGVQNDNWTAGANRKLVADEVLIGAFFGFYTTVGAGLIPVIRTDDGATNSGIVSSAVTAFALNAYHVLRIDFTNVANVLFYVDGVGVATGTTFTMAAGANVMVQPIVMAQKVGVDAGLGIFLLDYIKCWQATR